MKVMLDNGAYEPIRAHKTDAGMDLRSPVKVVVPAGGSATINTGVHVELPYGTVGMLKSKSGLNVNYGITSEGVIDVGYTGAIVVKLYNHSDTDYTVNAGDKITQLCVIECIYPDIEIVEELFDTERGANGFGSSGK